MTQLMTICFMLNSRQHYSSWWHSLMHNSCTSICGAMFRMVVHWNQNWNLRMWPKKVSSKPLSRDLFYNMHSITTIDMVWGPQWKFSLWFNPRKLHLPYFARSIWGRSCKLIFLFPKFIRLFIQIWSSTFKFDIHMPIPFMYTINHPIHSFLFFPFFFWEWGDTFYHICYIFIHPTKYDGESLEMEYKLQVVIVPFLLVKELWQTSKWKA